METISPNEINKVEVLKDQKAIQLYGKDGQNGVIIISTKGSKNTQ